MYHKISPYIYLTPISDENLFEVHEPNFQASVKPYRGMYNKLIILDGNKDGYDDVIFYCIDNE